MAAFSVLSSWAMHFVGMRSMTRRSFVIALLASAALAVGLAAGVARADKKRRRRGRRDHDDARRAREGGVILALPEVLGIVGPQIDGEIIETDFEYEHGRPIYAFKYVDRKGRVRELYVDARTAAILKDEPD